MNRLTGMAILFIAVLIFMGTRRWLDGKREAVQDVEVTRPDMDAGDAHLGLWAQKNKNALLQFRFKRDGSFLYELLRYPANDTSRYAGLYEIITTAGFKGNAYPRLVAVSNQGDTLINHYVYLTRAATRNIDVLALATDNNPATDAMIFYRIKQP